MPVRTDELRRWVAWPACRAALSPFPMEEIILMDRTCRHFRWPAVIPDGPIAEGGQRQSAAQAREVGTVGSGGPGRGSGGVVKEGTA